MKIKVNPLYIILIIVALVFAFGPLFFNLRRKIRFEKVEKKWISVELPGKVTDTGLPAKGLKFIASTDNYRSAIVAEIPAPDNSEIRKAFKTSSLEILAFLSKNILSEPLTEASCNIDLKTKTYVISGRRPSDNWYVSGRIWLEEEKNIALFIMVFADNKNDSRRAMQRVFESLKHKKS